MKTRRFFLLILFTIFLLTAAGLQPRHVLADIQIPSEWIKSIKTPGVVPGDQGLSFFGGNFLNFLLGWALLIAFLASLIALIVGGIMWSMSGGSKEGVTKARETVIYALVGLTLALLSFAIVAALQVVLGVCSAQTPGLCVTGLLIGP